MGRKSLKSGPWADTSDHNGFVTVRGGHQNRIKVYTTKTEPEKDHKPEGGGGGGRDQR